MKIGVVTGSGGTCDLQISHSGIGERMFVNNQPGGFVPIKMEFMVNASEKLKTTIYTNVSSFYGDETYFIPFKE